MFRLTVEEAVSTLILLENLIEKVDDEVSVTALGYAHDAIDNQILEWFGFDVEEEISDEQFSFLKENFKESIKFEVDDLVVDVLKAVFVPLLEHDEALTPQVKMYAAKILFKIS